MRSKRWRRCSPIRRKPAGLAAPCRRTRTRGQSPRGRASRTCGRRSPHGRTIRKVLRAALEAWRRLGDAGDTRAHRWMRRWPPRATAPICGARAWRWKRRQRRRDRGDRTLARGRARLDRSARNAHGRPDPSRRRCGGDGDGDEDRGTRTGTLFGRVAPVPGPDRARSGRRGRALRENLLPQAQDPSSRARIEPWLALAARSRRPAGAGGAAVAIPACGAGRAAGRAVDSERRARKLAPRWASSMAKRRAALLWGAPGSGVERIAGLLSGMLPALRSDRFGPRPPRDLLQRFTAIGELQLGTLAPEEVVSRWR